MKKVFSCALAAILTSGCMATSNELKPALLDAPAGTELEQALKAFLKHSVTLKSDAFINSSGLALEHPNIKDAQGNPIMGKQLEMPLQLQLLSDGQSCYIKRLDTEETIPLPGVNCHVQEQ